MVNCYSALATFAVAAAATPLSTRADSNQTSDKTFKDIAPSAELKYVPCYKNFTCANLEVPLDYENKEAGTTNIAFLKWSSPKQPAMGDIIFNPGGPGDSGVQFVSDLTDLLIPLLGDSYNIVGMDPRGVNNSGPSLDCFPGQPATRDFYSSQAALVDPRSEASLRTYYEYSGTFGTWCNQNLNDTANYANTPATARDMLHYFELLAECDGKPREEALVNFYGSSYGSALGTTFASLYPERVGRFLIDAVLDVEDYYYGNWSQNLLQADESVEGFFKLCAEAKEECALYKNGSTAEDIKKRVDKVLKNLEEDPVPVSDPYFVQFPTVFEHYDLRGQIMLSMYNPPAKFKILALSIAGLENRNGSYAASLSGKGIMPKAECDGTSEEHETIQPKLVIACNDNDSGKNMTRNQVEDLFKYQESLSGYFGELWASVILPQCRNLKFSPPKSQVFPGFKKTKTKTPILFADNTIDPVTSSYDKMAAFYEGAVVLKQKAIGHGLVVTTSNCTSSYVQNYFKTGELPPKDTICDTDFKPFAATPAS